MKSVGLLQLMLQSGMLLPVDKESEMGIFHRVFADIGDQQSIEDDLSTYSSRLQNAREFIKAADDRTLVLIDEFGSGTDPALGGAIAEGVLEGLNEKRVYGVITTHYSNLKIYAYKTEGIVNGGMNFDKDSLSPTYELKVGRPGSSYAFEIAQKSGLPGDVLAYARKRAGKNERAVDQLLVDLQREKQETEEQLRMLESKQKTLDALTRTYEELHRDIEVRRKRLKLEAKEQNLAETAKYNKDMENLIRTLREEKKIDEAKEQAKVLRETREKISEEVTDLRETIYYQPRTGKKQRPEFVEGDYVRLRTGGASGTIETVDKKRAILIVGDLRLTVNLRDLEHADNPMSLAQGKERHQRRECRSGVQQQTGRAGNALRGSFEHDPGICRSGPDVQCQSTADCPRQGKRRAQASRTPKTKGIQPRLQPQHAAPGTGWGWGDHRRPLRGQRNQPWKLVKSPKPWQRSPTRKPGRTSSPPTWSFT